MQRNKYFLKKFQPSVYGYTDGSESYHFLGKFNSIANAVVAAAEHFTRLVPQIQALGTLDVESFKLPVK